MAKSKVKRVLLQILFIIISLFILNNLRYIPDAITTHCESPSCFEVPIWVRLLRLGIIDCFFIAILYLIYPYAFGKKG